MNEAVPRLHARPAEFYLSRRRFFAVSLRGMGIERSGAGRPRAGADNCIAAFGGWQTGGARREAPPALCLWAAAAPARRRAAQLEGDMRKAALSMLVVLAGVWLAVPAQAQTADEVIEKHLAAMGGRAAMEKLQNRVATGTITVTVQGTPLAGSIEMYSSVPNKSRMSFRMDLSAMGAGEIVVDQRCDGKTAWASNSMQGDRDLTGTQLQAMVNEYFPTPLLGYKARGAKVEIAGKETVGTRPAIVVLFTPAAGHPSKYFFDAETYLPLQEVTKQDVPEAGGEVESKVLIEDLRTVDGVKVPFSVKIANPMQDIAITLDKVEHNKTIDETMFSKPAAK